MKYEMTNDGILCVELDNGNRIWIRENSVHLSAHGDFELVNHKPEPGDLWIKIVKE